MNENIKTDLKIRLLITGKAKQSVYAHHHGLLCLFNDVENTSLSLITKQPGIIGRAGLLCTARRDGKTGDRNG